MGVGGTGRGALRYEEHFLGVAYSIRWGGITRSIRLHDAGSPLHDHPWLSPSLPLSWKKGGRLRD